MQLDKQHSSGSGKMGSERNILNEKNLIFLHSINFK